MSKPLIVDIRDFKFPEITIEANTFVIWRNLDPQVHSAETLPDDLHYFNAGPMFPGGVSSPVLFQVPGKFEYICRFHADMKGIVNVQSSQATNKNVARDLQHAGEAMHGGHDHLMHFHGFVTGGRSGQRFFMTHTPVIADERHRYQVILQGSLTTKENIAAYDKLRSSSYGDGAVQIFHDHLSLPDIGHGTIKLLPEASFEYYPAGIDADGEPVSGLEKGIPVQLDKVIHFHEFDPDSDYPPALTYLMYGDMDDVFIDHFINRAPSFHTVAKLKSRPDFWTEANLGQALEISIPSKHIIDVSPKLMERVAFVDNSFHMFWLPPSGIYLRPPGHPQDPLIPRAQGQRPVYEVLVKTGTKGQIEVGRFLHFDVRLLNYGVLIT